VQRDREQQNESGEREAAHERDDIVNVKAETGWKVRSGK
jgi:hypothetical protein